MTRRIDLLGVDDLADGEMQLFYLESRGIPPDEARKFIVLGYLEPVVSRVPLASARDRLRELLEAKWTSGTDGATGSAAA